MPDSSVQEACDEKTVPPLSVIARNVSDEAIQLFYNSFSGLLRFARNDIKKVLQYFLIFSIFLILPGCIGAAMSGANAIYNHNELENKFSDYSIDFQIEQAINKVPSLTKNFHVVVIVFKRLVLLVGQVPSEEARKQTVAAAQTVSGAIRIYNFITVGPPTSISVRSSDIWITTKVRSKIIADKDLYPDKVKVVTEDGVVYLMGIVTKEEADSLVEMARDTSGVQKVVKIFFYMIMPELK